MRTTTALLSASCAIGGFLLGRSTRRHDRFSRLTGSFVDFLQDENVIWEVLEYDQETHCVLVQEHYTYDGDHWSDDKCTFKPSGTPYWKSLMSCSFSLIHIDPKRIKRREEDELQ